MLEKYLLDIGLSDKEIKVYLSSLELGESSVLDISKKSKVNRTTIYPIIDSLTQKGLMSLVQKGKKQYFYAESPSKIRTFVDSKINDLEASKSNLPDLIKQLSAIENSRSDKPAVRFYEGNEGINSMLEEFLQSSEIVSDPDSAENKMYITYSRDLQEKSVSESDREYRRQIRNKSKVKSVYLYTKEEGELVSDELRKRVKINEKIYPIPAHIAVFKDRIRLISYTKNTGILIVDRELAETLRSIMRLAEKGA
jgi:HTH-type transcriptional regulator, sugar sensing transcriptional regulator